MIKDENIKNILDYLKHYCESNKLDMSIMITKDIKHYIVVEREERNEPCMLSWETDKKSRT